VKPTDRPTEERKEGRKESIKGKATRGKAASKQAKRGRQASKTRKIEVKKSVVRPSSHFWKQPRRWWIEKWIHDKSAALESRPRHGTGVLSPMGHGMLKHAKLVSNQAVRRLANQWREKHEKAM